MKTLRNIQKRKNNLLLYPLFLCTAIFLLFIPFQNIFAGGVWDPEIVAIANQIYNFVGANPRFYDTDDGIVLVGENGRFRIDFPSGHDPNLHAHIEIPKQNCGKPTRNYKDACPGKHRHYFSRDPVPDLPKGGGRGGGGSGGLGRILGILQAALFLNDWRRHGLLPACENLFPHDGPPILLEPGDPRLVPDPNNPGLYILLDPNDPRISHNNNPPFFEDPPPIWPLPIPEPPDPELENNILIIPNYLIQNRIMD